MTTLLASETFQLSLPQGWTQRSDEECLYGVCTDPPGVLCCTPSLVEDSDQLPNLSRMLAGFLTRSGHPVATDELLRVSGVANAHGFCWQYVENERFHRIWVFGNQVSWLLLTFTSGAEAQSTFHPLLNEMIATLALQPPK